MPYRVSLTPAARRDFRALSPHVQARIQPSIDNLADDPRPPGCKRMQGQHGMWRIRVGDYRVLYTVDDAAATVTVTAIAHRGDVYRRP